MVEGITFDTFDGELTSSKSRSIEYAWGELSRYLKYKQPFILNVETLKEHFKVTWKNLNVDFMQALYISMPDKCSTIIQEKGDVTRY